MDLRLSGRVVDLERGEVRAGAERIRLTTREIEVLAYLAARAGQPVSRDELHTDVWRMPPTVASRAVDFTLHRLRAKLEPQPSEPRHLLKVHGVGYKLLVDTPAADTPPVATVLAAHVDRVGLRYREAPEATDLAVLGLRHAVSSAAAALGGAVSSTFPPRVVFPRADDALEASRRLVAGPLPVCVALATGPVTWWTEDGRAEVQGWTAERSAVLARSWQPGHVVLDEQTAAALGDVGLRDLGLRVHPELPDRLQVFEAPLRAAPAPEVVRRSTNLWRYADRLVGREPALLQLLDLVGEHGVVALWGPAGIGKTRLARELGLRWLAARPTSEAWFCDLRPATSPDAALVAIAEATGLPADRHRGGRALRARGPALLVLDDADPDATGVVELAEAWAAAAPEARLVLTSRTRPAVEVVVPVDPLGPDDAAALLLERARARLPGFGADDPAAVAALVARLDGVPLALELTAAAARSPSASQLSATVVDPGMDAALERTWSSLAPGPRGVLAALAVFPARFSLEDAEVVAAVPDAMDALAALQDRALLVEHPNDAWSLFDAVRRFATARDPESFAAAEARRAALVLDRAEDALARLHGLGEADAVATLRRDLPDLLAVVERAGSDAIPKGRAVAALASLLGRTGPRRLLADLTEPLVPTAERHAPPVAMALLRTAWSLWHQDGRKEAAADALERCVRVARQAGDERQALLAEGRLAALRLLELDARAAEQTRVVDALEALGSHGFAGTIAIELGHALVVGGRVGPARDAYRRALALQRQAGDRRGEGVVLVNLGNVLRYVGAWDEAAAHARAAVRLLTEAGDERNLATALGLLGSCLAGGGVPGEGREVLERALAAVRRAGAEQEELAVANNLAEASILVGDVAGVRRRATEAQELARAVGSGYWADASLPLLAAAQWLEGDRAGAVEALRRALPRLQRHAPPWSWTATLAAWLRAQGEVDEARALAAALPETPAADDTGETVPAVRAFVETGDSAAVRLGSSWALRRLAAMLA
jgi:DNA-binding winged helix-turn-helix (wHTH) protein/tetratricopeptide (TPR) repeat protein